jgi:general secretion pathway protein D
LLSTPKTPTVEPVLPEESTDLIQGEIKFVADEINNALIVQASPQDYETILETVKSLDVVPRQVLIDAKIYEVALTGALSMGVQAFLEQRAARPPTAVSFTAAADRGRRAGLDLTTFARIGGARDLLVFLNAQETRSRTRVLSSPSVIASDNIGARIQVGSEVPMLTSQGVIPGGTGSNGLFSNTIQNRSTGVILNVTPRINSGGWVTLKIQQEVSSPVAPAEGSGIQSPSISIRSVDTQVTVKDGESIALGGIIAENRLLSKNRIPFLGDLPGVGLLFGNTTYTNSRTELIAIITPHVIQDIESASDVTDELKSQLKNMKNELRRLDYGNR